ncbi:hypothetical protein MKZ38_007714 [Zalerion maritima]|uniref:Uncharacterized protein n=1 Tax=Zalerion maritima TaxID=339359 RepID=A0AAD5WP23_9PEZI|nr:hypothetical protein MKZ38_007714 [Zalerion maritima]
MTFSKSSSTAQQQDSASSAPPPTINDPNSSQPQQEIGLGLTQQSPATGTTAAPSAAAPSNSNVKSTAAPPTVANTDISAITKAKEKVKKKGLFGFGKKKTDDKQKQRQQSQQLHPSRSGTASPDSTNLSKPAPGMSSTRASTTSPSQLDQVFRTPSSPGRVLSASSPRLISPAGSQIFERDVQESTVLPNSPAIPSHIPTENHIPPVLDASSEAITDGHLSPDSVEIITHTQHQPAAATLSGAPSCDNLSSAWEQDLQRELNNLGNEKDDAASNYGSFDSNDVRRLSFISFADVVQAEHASHPGNQTGSRDSIHLAGLTSLSSMNMNRSSSPMRSPVSSQGLGTSPPTSKSGSVKGIEMSPNRKPIGSPTSAHHTLPVIGSEVNVETMSQALRRTGSADLSGVRSMPTSPIEGPSR